MECIEFQNRPEICIDPMNGFCRTMDPNQHCMDSITKLCVNMADFPNNHDCIISGLVSILPVSISNPTPIEF